MLGRIIAILGVVVQVAFCVWLCDAVARAGHSELIGPLVLWSAGSIIAWLGALLVIGTAFSENVTQGLCCIFVPFYLLIYV